MLKDFLVLARHPKEFIGVLLVVKAEEEKNTRKEGTRTIIDARGANRHFVIPPGVELCTHEGFSRIKVKMKDDVEP